MGHRLNVRRPSRSRAQGILIPDGRDRRLRRWVCHKWLCSPTNSSSRPLRDHHSPYSLFCSLSCKLSLNRHSSRRRHHTNSRYLRTPGTSCSSSMNLNSRYCTGKNLPVSISSRMCGNLHVDTACGTCTCRLCFIALITETKRIFFPQQKQNVPVYTSCHTLGRRAGGDGLSYSTWIPKRSISL